MDPLQSPAVTRFVAESPIERRLISAWVARAAADAPKGAKVLDAGAGDAPYAEMFEHCLYTTADWAASVHPGAARADVIAPLDALPLPDAEFSVVLCTQVLEHVAEPLAVLAELHRVLEPGGRLWLTVPFVGELHEEPYDFYRYTCYALEHLCRGAGFTEVDVTPLGGWFSAVGQVARNYALSTGVTAGERSGSRVLGAALRMVGGQLPRLDRLDRRRALPLGYGVRAVRMEPSARS